MEMRMIFAITVGLGLTMPAFAAVEEDFTTANRIFGQNAAGPVLDALDGEWLPLATLANTRGENPAEGLVSGMLEQFCGNDPVRGSRIEALSDTSFSIEAPGRSVIVSRFDWLNGSVFSRSVDPDALFAGLGLDKIDGDRGVEARAKALEQAQQDVHVYRVSADILVVASSQNSEIYGRCPANGD